MLGTFFSISSGQVFAQRVERRLRVFRRARRHARSLTFAQQNDTFSFSFPDTLDSLFESSIRSDLYDSITVMNFRRLKEQADPYWDGDEADPIRSRRAAEKGLAMQTATSLSNVLKKSELRDTYFQLREAFRDLQNTFRYSVQSDGESLTVSRSSKGKKWLELQMEFNAKRGVDPQIRLGDHLRLRYDFIESRPLLEVGADF